MPSSYIGNSSYNLAPNTALYSQNQQRSESLTKLSSLVVGGYNQIEKDNYVRP